MFIYDRIKTKLQETDVHHSALNVIEKESIGPFRNISVSSITQQVYDSNLLTFYEWFMKMSLL